MKLLFIIILVIVIFLFIKYLFKKIKIKKILNSSIFKYIPKKLILKQIPIINQIGDDLNITFPDPNLPNYLINLI